MVYSCLKKTTSSSFTSLLIISIIILLYSMHLSPIPRFIVFLGLIYHILTYFCYEIKIFPEIGNYGLYSVSIKSLNVISNALQIISTSYIVGDTLSFSILFRVVFPNPVSLSNSFSVIPLLRLISHKRIDAIFLFTSTYIVN